MLSFSRIVTVSLWSVSKSIVLQGKGATSRWITELGITPWRARVREG
jgi:hypothetical protein